MQHLQQEYFNSCYRLDLDNFYYLLGGYYLVFLSIWRLVCYCMELTSTYLLRPCVKNPFTFQQHLQHWSDLDLLVCYCMDFNFLLLLRDHSLFSHQLQRSIYPYSSYCLETIQVVSTYTQDRRWPLFHHLELDQL